MTKKQNRELAYVRKRDPEKLYRFSEDSIMREVDILEEEVEGKTIQSLLDENAKLKEDLAALQARVGYHIRNAGVKSLEEVVVINPNKEYAIAEVDENQFVQNTAIISTDAKILEGQPIPDGVEIGYHKVEKGEIVEDDKIKRSYYRLM